MLRRQTDVREPRDFVHHIQLCAAGVQQNNRAFMCREVKDPPRILRRLTDREAEEEMKSRVNNGVFLTVQSRRSNMELGRPACYLFRGATAVYFNVDANIAKFPTVFMLIFDLYINLLSWIP